MKQNATVFVKGIQSVDGESAVTELSGEGTVEITATGLRLSYSEILQHNQQAQTVLTLIGETVNIHRTGENEMRMVVQKGKRHVCTMQTPMGALTLGTYGISLSHEDARLHLSYELDIDSALMSRNELEIRYETDT